MLWRFKRLQQLFLVFIFNFFPPSLCSFLHIFTPYSHKPNPPLMKVKKKKYFSLIPTPHTNPPLTLSLSHTLTLFLIAFAHTRTSSQKQTLTICRYFPSSHKCERATHTHTPLHKKKSPHTPSTDVCLNFVTRSQSFSSAPGPWNTVGFHILVCKRTR